MNRKLSREVSQAALSAPHEPGAEPATQAAPIDHHAEAARVMFAALTEISQADAFFDGEKRLKGVALRALNKVRELGRQAERARGQRS